MSTDNAKQAYIKPTWTEVQGPWSFFIGFSSFAPLVVVVVPAWVENQENRLVILDLMDLDN